jgi:hypothetical protein
MRRTPGGEFRILDVQFDVLGEVAAMTPVTEIIRPQALCFSYRGQHGFGAQPHKTSSVAAGTGPLSLFPTRRIELQQLAEHGRSRLMHAGASRHLHSFQIQIAVFLFGAEDPLPQQMHYFTGDFLLDDFRSFFSARSVPTRQAEPGRSSR